MKTQFINVHNLVEIETREATFVPFRYVENPIKKWSWEHFKYITTEIRIDIIVDFSQIYKESEYTPTRYNHNFDNQGREVYFFKNINGQYYNEGYVFILDTEKMLVLNGTNSIKLSYGNGNEEYLHFDTYQEATNFENEIKQKARLENIIIREVL